MIPLEAIKYVLLLVLLLIAGPLFFYLFLRFFVRRSFNDRYVTLPKWLEKMAFPFPLKREASARIVDGEKQRIFVVACICTTAALMIYLIIIIGVITIFTGKLFFLNELNEKAYLFEWFLIVVSGIGADLWSSIQEYRELTTARERRRKRRGIIIGAVELAIFVLACLALLFDWI